MDPQQNQFQPQNQQPTQVTPPNVQPPVQPNLQAYTPPPNKKSSKGLLIGLAVLLLLVAGAAAYWFVLRGDTETDTVSNNYQTAENESESAAQEELAWTPFKEGDKEGLKIVHDDTWSSNIDNNKYWSITRGLIKNSGSQKYVITMEPSEINGVDYLNRAAGGAYPPGTLYKTVETKGAGTVHVGTFSMNGGTNVFVSTCPLTANGGCSLDIGGGSLWVIELNRYDESKDTDVMNVTAAMTPLNLSDTANQSVLDEFVAMIATMEL